LASLLTFGAGVSLFTSADGRELRDLIGLDDGFGSTTTLTDREADRAADLFGDLLVAAIPWIIVLGIVYALASAWSWAIVARVAASHSTASSQGADDSPESFVEPPAESAGEIAGAALRRVPAVIGSSMLIGVIFLGLVVASIVPVAVVAALDIGAAAVVLTVLFVAVAAIALGVWLWGRLALAPVIAALGGHGVGLGRSWALTNGRFWYVVGRLVVAGLMAGALGQVVSLLTNFGIFLPVTVLLVLVLVVQTAVSVISTIVQVAAMVVALDQVSAAAEALGPTTGSSGPRVHA
jgi:hypothetical protein